MQARLVVFKDGKEDLSVPFVESGVGIGRDVDNGVQLPSPEVSKRHAFVKYTPSGWCVRDLDSRNGVFVNGKRVRETILNNHDQLTVGPYTIFFTTDAPDSQYRPVIAIDNSSNVVQQTMATPRGKIG